MKVWKPLSTPPPGTHITRHPLPLTCCCCIRFSAAPALLLESNVPLAAAASALALAAAANWGLFASARFFHARSLLTRRAVTAAALGPAPAAEGTPVFITPADCARHGAHVRAGSLTQRACVVCAWCVQGACMRAGCRVRACACRRGHARVHHARLLRTCVQGADRKFCVFWYFVDVTYSKLNITF